MKANLAVFTLSAPAFVAIAFHPLDWNRLLIQVSQGFNRPASVQTQIMYRSSLQSVAWLNPLGSEKNSLTNICAYEPPPEINGPARTGGSGGRYHPCSASTGLFITNFLFT